MNLKVGRGPRGSGRKGDPNPNLIGTAQGRQRGAAGGENDVAMKSTNARTRADPW